MNYQDNIIYLAQVNSRSCHPKRREDINEQIPFFEIKKDQLGKYDIKSYNYETHDNAPRMQLWEQYLKTAILPNVDPNANLCGFYNIQLHDSYTYLDHDEDYKDVLCFTKFKTDPDPILIPDPYMICNYGNMLNSVNDELDWSKKMNKVCFYGTTTGHRDPKRIDLCIWARDKRNVFDFYITKIAQMSSSDCQKVPGFDAVYRNPVSISEQLKYKYHLMMDGNTCRFDVWYFKANNVVMKYPSKEMLWYYPMIQDDTHYVEVNRNNITNKMEFFNNNPQHAYCMIYDAKKLCNTLFRPIVHQMYTINLFESMALN